MNYHNIYHDSMKDGEGLRTVLYVSGCTNACKGCFNPETWPFDSGIPFDDAARQEIFQTFEDSRNDKEDYLSGLSVLGGDPMHPYNVDTVTELCAEFKDRYPDKTIWLWTGYDFDYVLQHPIIQYLDVVIDGRFIEELKDTKLWWKGSSNQRVIDVKRSLSAGCVVLYDG